MKGLKRNLKTRILSAVIIIFTLIVVVSMVYASTKDLGSKDDPIVTLSYLEEQITRLKDYIDKKSTLSDGSQPISSADGATYEVVELEKGQYLVAGAGTEIILRAGEATAIISPLGGLSDVTGARDIQQDERIPTNHLLIIPRDDGRGLRALSDSFLLVRGKYTIK